MTALVEVTQEDREASKELRHEIQRQIGNREGLGLIENGDFDVQLLGRHRIAALEEAARVAEEVRDGFLSPEYATGQPLSSFQERFACNQVVDAIRKAKEGSRG